MSDSVRSSGENLLDTLSQHEDIRATVQGYHERANDYDAYFTPEKWGGPIHASDAILARFPAQPEPGQKSRAELRVFDVAAGTGLLAQRLYDGGFRKMDCLEPAEQMVAVARQRNIYTRFIVDTIGEHPIDVEDNTYDIVTLAGGFLPGHVPVAAIPEMLRVCKPGGVIIFSMRLRFLVIDEEYRKMEPMIQSLEKQGWLQCLSREIRDGYVAGHEGVVYTLRKL